MGPRIVLCGIVEESLLHWNASFTIQVLLRTPNEALPTGKLQNFLEGSGSFSRYS